jgi:hypothetical protein
MVVANKLELEKPLVSILTSKSSEFTLRQSLRLFQDHACQRANVHSLDNGTNCLFNTIAGNINDLCRPELQGPELILFEKSKN